MFIEEQGAGVPVRPPSGSYIFSKGFFYKHANLSGFGIKNLPGFKSDSISQGSLLFDKCSFFQNLSLFFDDVKVRSGWQK